MTVDGYPTPMATVDVVLLTVREGELAVFLPRRDREPHADALALPGGVIFMDRDRDTLDTATRVLRDKVGIAAPYLEQLGTFSGTARDPRGWSLSVAYVALLPMAGLLAAGHAEASVHAVATLPGLPFDHAAIVSAAVSRVRVKSEYSTLPLFMMPDEFTITELLETYQHVLGEKQNDSAFRRKMMERAMIVPVQGKFRRTGSSRPAQVYRRASEGLMLLKNPI